MLSVKGVYQNKMLKDYYFVVDYQNDLQQNLHAGGEVESLRREVERLREQIQRPGTPQRLQTSVGGEGSVQVRGYWGP